MQRLQPAQPFLLSGQLLKTPQCNIRRDLRSELQPATALIVAKTGSKVVVRLRGNHALFTQAGKHTLPGTGGDVVASGQAQKLAQTAVDCRHAALIAASQMQVQQHFRARTVKISKPLLNDPHMGGVKPVKCGCPRLLINHITQDLHAAPGILQQLNAQVDLHDRNVCRLQYRKQTRVSIIIACQAG